MDLREFFDAIEAEGGAELTREEHELIVQTIREHRDGGVTPARRSRPVQRRAGG